MPEAPLRSVDAAIFGSFVDAVFSKGNADLKIEVIGLVSLVDTDFVL